MSCLLCLSQGKYLVRSGICKAIVFPINGGIQQLIRMKKLFQFERGFKVSSFKNVRRRKRKSRQDKASFSSENGMLRALSKFLSYLCVTRASSLSRSLSLSHPVPLSQPPSVPGKKVISKVCLILLKQLLWQASTFIKWQEQTLDCLLVWLIFKTLNWNYSISAKISLNFNSSASHLWSPLLQGEKIIRSFKGR